jgi:hypothetical protein
MEEWKIVPFANNYECSKLGVLRNKSTTQPIKGKDQDGYVKVGFIDNDGKTIIKFLHRVIAITWLENPENKPTVDHINSIRNDNRVSNLRWATYKEQYSNISPENKIKNPGIKIWQCNKDTGDKIKLYNNMAEATKDLGVKTPAQISACLDETDKIAFGYKWIMDFPVIEGEIWKLFEEHDDHKYYGSNHGRVKNNNRLLKISYSSGYQQTYIYDKLHKNHIVVAKLFIENPNNHPIVNHKDGNKLNNHESNLEWTTIRENAKHAVENGLNKSHKKVINYDNDNNIIKIYLNCADAGRDLGVSKSSIDKCCKNIIRSCGEKKLKFKYLEAQDDIVCMKINIPIKEDAKIKPNIQEQRRKVISYDDDLTILHIYNSGQDAATQLNLDASAIIKCCNGKRKTCGGKQFKYLDENDDIKNMKITMEKENIYVNIPKDSLYKKVNVHNKKGKLIETCNSKAEVTKKYKVNIETVTKHCQNKIKYHKLDYIFSYAE